MKIVLSPAKRMSAGKFPADEIVSRLPMVGRTNELVAFLKQCTPEELGRILSLSGNAVGAAELLYSRFGSGMNKPEKALFAFTGTAFTALDPRSFSEADLLFAQEHLRIFSGLYGLLRPMDGIEPYRLDVGDRLKLDEYKNLYDFWRDDINRFLIEEGQHELIFNLASEEYFKLIDPARFASNSILTLSFKEFRNGKLKAVSPAVKRARGLMARYIIQHQILDRESVKMFDEDNYLFSPDHSSETEYVFIR